MISQSGRAAGMDTADLRIGPAAIPSHRGGRNDRRAAPQGAAETVARHE